MTKALTNKTLEALKPTGKRYAVHDAHCPGLAVRVNANGTKTFTATYRYGLKQRRLTIGPYASFTVTCFHRRASVGHQIDRQGRGGDRDTASSPAIPHRATDAPYQSDCARADGARRSIP